MYNIYVVIEFEVKGVIFVEEVDEVLVGVYVVFSVYGVLLVVVNVVFDCGFYVIDVICLLVIKVYCEVVWFVCDDFEILFIGYDGYEEVEGMVGEVFEYVMVVNFLEEVDIVVVKDLSKVVWLL